MGLRYIYIYTHTHTHTHIAHTEDVNEGCLKTLVDNLGEFLVTRGGAVG